MYIGQRIAIPGVVLGALVLTAFLLAITAGLSLPDEVHAAVPLPAATQAAPEPAISSDGIVVEGDPLIDVVDTASIEQEGVGTGSGCAVSPNFPAGILQWCEQISQYAFKRNLPPDLVAAVILQESGGDPQAYSHSGAVGLMQVMPKDGIAATFMCKNGPCFSNRPSSDELWDPDFNIRYGTKMLENLVARLGSYREALKSYGPMDVGYYYADLVLGIYQNYGQNTGQ